MNTRQIGRDLGLFFATREVGISCENPYAAVGADEVLEEHFRKTAHRDLMSSVYKIFNEFDKGQTKTARHILALSKYDRDHSEHVKEASDVVFDAVKDAEAMEKMAGWSDSFAHLLAGGSGELAGAALTTLGVGSAVVGSGAGALYWQAKREMDEDNAANEAKKRKIKYYKRLTGDLEKSMNDRYGGSVGDSA